MIFVQFYNNERFTYTLLNKFMTIDLLEALEKELEKTAYIILQLEN